MPPVSAAGTNTRSCRVFDERSRSVAERTHSSGWVTFSMWIAGIAGVLNLIVGFAAMRHLGPFAAPELVFLHLYTWGVVLLVAGVFQLGAAVLLARRSSVGRVLAMIMASLSLISWCLWIGAYTTAAVTAILLDVLVLFGLSGTSDQFS